MTQLEPSTLLLPRAESGKTVAQRSMGEQQLVVKENDDYRWLYFDNGHVSTRQKAELTPIQSLMRLDQKSELALPYMQRMVMWLACFPQGCALNVLQLGLGGGAIDRWFTQLPLCHNLTSVECSAEVIRCYHDFFPPATSIGNEQQEQSIVQADAAEYLGHVAAGSFDMVLIDLYESSAQKKGMPAAASTVGFYQSIANSLANSGVLVANIAHGSKENIQPVFGHLSSLGLSLGMMNVPAFQNVLVIASPEPLTSKLWASSSAIQPYLALDIASAIDEILYI